MIEYFKIKLTQENIAVFLFSAAFWLSITNNKITNGVIIICMLWGIYLCFKRWYDILDYFKESKYLYFFLLFWIPLLLSTFDSSALKYSIRYDLNMLRYFFVGAIVVFLTRSSIEKIRYCILSFIVVVSLDACVEWLFGYHLLGESRDRVRIMGLFSYYDMGFYLATILPILFYQLLVTIELRKYDSYFWILIVMSSFIAIFVAGARAGWLTLLSSIIMCFGWLIFRKKISLKKILISIVAISIVGVLILQIPMVHNRFFNPNNASTSAIGSYEWVDKVSSNRLVLWEFSWKQFKENPVLGDGVGSFKPLFSSQPADAKNGHTVAYFPHLQGLEVLAETGIFGFILYTLILFWLLILIFTSKIFPMWFITSFLAIMPINMHVALYGSFWSILVWVPLILGLRERYLLKNDEKSLENALK